MGRERAGRNPPAVSTSERTGIRELYAVELNGDSNPRLYLTARVPTGFHDMTIVGRGSSVTSVVATVTHADGRHLERFEVDRAAWIEAPAPAAPYAPRTGARDAPQALSDATASRPYSPIRDLFPTG